jgi:hypothetical protein
MTTYGMIVKYRVDRNEEATYPKVEYNYVTALRRVRKANVMLGRRL